MEDQLLNATILIFRTKNITEDNVSQHIEDHLSLTGVMKAYNTLRIK